MGDKLKDLEADKLYLYKDKPKDLQAEKLFDLGTLRENPTATTYVETLMHFIKSCIGTGIFSLPYAFKNAGIVLGTVGLLATAIICCHCAYILVICAQRFYYYTNKPSLTYAEVVDYAFANGPACGKKLGKIISVTTALTIFITYFGSCSVYAVIVATNMQELILEYYETEINIRSLLLFLLIPFLLITWIPNLKKLAIVSTTANIFMFVAISIIFSYFFTNISEISDRKKADIVQLPEFLSNAIFALEAIGAVLPLENDMKKPKDFVGFAGVLVVTTVIITVVYWAFGFFGYVRYGDDVQGSIIQNLPTDEIFGQVVKILASLTIFAAFGIQMYVSVDVSWNHIKDRYTHPLLGNYLLRTLLCIGCIGLAIGIPTIAPFMGLIGALCFSLLGIILPILIELMTFWDDGFGKFYCIIWKDIIVLAFGVFVLIFGTFTSALNIIENLKDV